MKYTVKTKFNEDRIYQEVNLDSTIEDYTQNLYTQVLELKEKGVRDALIELGWTPPKEATK